jgi:cysteine desulfurase
MSDSGMIYLDYNATTPCDPEVIRAMLPYFAENYANPSSAIHRAGKLAADAVENARAQVAELIGSSPKGIVFTAGATESNNLAILGIARASTGNRKRIVTTAVEHKSVLAPCRELEEYGYDVTILPVDRDGSIDLNVAQEQ